MFLLARPSPARIAAFLAESERLPLSYEPAGLAKSGVAAGYSRDESREALGRGQEVFRRAWDALQAWKQFDFAWVEIFASGPATTPGTIVAVLIRHAGCWSLNGGRILYTLEDDDRSLNRGYAYGTLTNHAERGEEIFRVSMDRQSGEVTYGILAVSRPSSPLAWCGYPIARHLQHRFRRDSSAAMRRAVR